MYEYEIYPSNKVIIATFTGDITADNIIECVTKFLSDKRYTSDITGVIDFRNAKLDMTDEDQKRIAGFVISTNTVKGKWASLTNKPHDTALSTLYESSISSMHEFKTFYTVRSASEYLGTDLLLYMEDDNVL